MSLGFNSINSCLSIEARSPKELKPVPEKAWSDINRNLNSMLDLCKSSNLPKLTMKDNDNIFMELDAKEIGSALYNKIMKKSIRKSLNLDWCYSLEK